ncbi:universal stress protein [Streptomyces sp. H27-H1]|uniref:universal stress protein n=1 Tax=Streptomyces sp. H27-H1 TaxID=2996461 RepID=UPI002D1E4606|nr:universal stress protein [Streptomyces sp. H27-H1]
MDQSPRPVIVAVDGSANGNRALEWAISQTLMAGAPLRIVHARLYVNTIGAAVECLATPYWSGCARHSTAAPGSPRSSTPRTLEPPTRYCPAWGRTPS